MKQKQYIKIGLLPWMPKNIEALKKQHFWTTQESIDEAFQKAIWKTIERWEQLASIRDAEMWASTEWKQEKANAMRNLEVHVRDIKDARQVGREAYEGDWVMIDHIIHMYMTYQEFIDYNLKHWTDWQVGESKGNFYGFTEKQLKAYYPEKRFNAEKMQPCTCKMCEPQWHGKTYYF